MTTTHANATTATREKTPAHIETAAVEARLAAHYKPIGLRAVAAAAQAARRDEADAGTAR